MGSGSFRLPLVRRFKVTLLLPAVIAVLLVAGSGLAQEAPPQDIVNQKPDEKPAVSVQSPVLTTLESLAPDRKSVV